MNDESEQASPIYQIDDTDHQSHFTQKNLRQKRKSYENCAIFAFLIIICVMVLYKWFSADKRYTEEGKFYRQELLSYELIDFWKRTPEQLNEEQAKTNDQLIENGKHEITREELGHNSWELLHMMTGSFPNGFSQDLAKKFNVFLLAFGQFYPCKLCANHFMSHLKVKGLFTGTTKLELMTYLCELHNEVNLSLGKQHHDCSNIVEEWNNCGCSQL